MRGNGELTGKMHSVCPPHNAAVPLARTREPSERAQLSIAWNGSSTTSWKSLWDCTCTHTHTHARVFMHQEFLGIQAPTPQDTAQGASGIALMSVCMCMRMCA